MHDDHLWLNRVLQTESIDAGWLELAIKTTLADELGCKAFNINQVNVREQVEVRACLFRHVYNQIAEMIGLQLKISVDDMLPTVWRFWLPLAIAIANARKTLGRPFVQGILGGQGTGKTTLAQALNLILPHLGYRSASLSIDDLYLTYQERCELRQRDERLIWRGPPGTHDLELGLDAIAKFRSGVNPLCLPRFDKSLHNGMGDRTTPECFENIDILLFEGWFVGARPIDPVAFDCPPAPIKTKAERDFAKDMNLALHNYLPLWEQLDNLLVLFPIDYRFSLQWRKQAEQNMIRQGKTGMTENQIEEFVNYFWCALHPELFIKPLTQSKEYADLVIEINAKHGFDWIYEVGSGGEEERGSGGEKANS